MYTEYGNVAHLACSIQWLAQASNCSAISAAIVAAPGAGESLWLKRNAV